MWYRIKSSEILASNRNEVCLELQSRSCGHRGFFRTSKLEDQTDSQVHTSRRKFAKPELRRVAKRTHKSTQVCKTRTWGAVRTYEGWPNGFASRLGSSRRSQKVVNFTESYNTITCNQLVSTCVGWPNDEKLAWICARIESTHVGGQTKRKMNATRKLALTCESVWPAALESWKKYFVQILVFL